MRFLKLSFWQRTKAPLTTDREGLLPLVVTSLGRSGTTWVMKLLSSHPGIAVAGSYPYEIRAACYWMHIFYVLSRSADEDRTVDPNDFLYDLRRAGPSPFHAQCYGSSVMHWFREDYRSLLADFCKDSVNRFYGTMAYGVKEDSVFFAEKCPPTPHIQPLFWEFYPQGKEIILVRDFRDMVSSIMAFNKKRGYAGFGREAASSDEEYIQRLRGSARALLDAWKQRSSKAFLLRYEDLVSRPFETLQEMLAYLNLETSNTILERMLHVSSRNDRETKYHKTSRSPQQSVGRWQHDLDDALKALCQSTFGDILKAFDYKVDV